MLIEARKECENDIRESPRRQKANYKTEKEIPTINILLLQVKTSGY